MKEAGFERGDSGSSTLTPMGTGGLGDGLARRRSSTSGGKGSEPTSLRMSLITSSLVRDRGPPTAGETLSWLFAMSSLM